MDFYANGLTTEYLRQKIPIAFTYKGRTYSGYFSFVQGAGGLTWHLYIAQGYY